MKLNESIFPFSATTFTSTLHNILLCRPGMGSLEKISKFLELMSYRSNDFLDTLCVQRNAPDMSEPQGFIRYTADSCPLQTYALLIRLYTLPNEKVKFTVAQLTAITESTLLFMRYSLLKSPKWFIAGKCANCLCRARLFGAVVSLLYVYFTHWIEYPNDIGKSHSSECLSVRASNFRLADSQSVSIMAKFGIEFFYESLVKNYGDELLNAGGTIIKNRIRIIVEWLNSYDFNFKSAHREFLLLSMSRSMDTYKPIHSNG